MKKKILAALLVFAMLAQTVTIFAAETVASEEETTTEVVNEVVEYIVGENNVGADIKFSMDMGLITKYIPEAEVTRKEVRDALRLIYNDDFKFDEYFTEGYDYDKVSVDDAIKLLMDAAGFGPYMAMNTKADALAYRNEAARLGLITGAKYTAATEKFTNEIFYGMFYDALNMPMFGATYSNKGASYMYTEDTLMHQYLELYKAEGVVTTNSIVSLTGDPLAAEGAIAINGYTFNTFGVENADDYLGYSVIAYINEDGQIRSLAVDTQKNKQMVFVGSDDIKTPTSLTSIDYFRSENSTAVATINIKSAAPVVYNNAIAANFDPADYKIANGTIKFIDNDADKTYDVVFIEEVVCFYPEFIDYRGNTIVDEVGNPYDVSDIVNGRMYLGIHDAEGKVVEFEKMTTALPVAVALLYGTSSASEVTIHSDSTFEGVYTNYKGSADKPYTIGDKEFGLSLVYAAKNNGSLPFAIGDRLKLFLDPYGKIMKAQALSNAEMYGYLFGFDTNDDDLFASDIQALILPTSGKTEVRSLAKSVSYNGTKVAEDKFVQSSSVPELYAAGKIKPQLIKYKLNAKGEISLIRTATLNCATFGVYKTSEDAFEINYGNADGTPKQFLYYGGTIKAVQAKYRFKNTVVFKIPNNASDYVEYATTQTISTLEDSYSRPDGYTMLLYDVDEYYVIGAAVEEYNPYGDDAKVLSQNQTGAIVMDVGNKIDSKTGDVIEYLAYVKTGNEGSVDVAPQVITPYRKDDAENGKVGPRQSSIATFDDLRPGDVIKWVTNSKGQLCRFRVTFAPDFTKPFESQTFEYDFEKGATSDTEWGVDTYTFAKVVSKDINGIVINADGSTCTDRFYNRSLKAPSSQLVTFFDVSEGTAVKGTLAEVKPSDFIYVQYGKWNLIEMIVYRP